MTEKLYDSDSHLKEFTAQVISCEQTEKGYAVVLDRTTFFPEGGGQASDRGTLGDVAVTDVQLEDDTIIHYTVLPLPQGQQVTGTLDWRRRFDYMQNHSGEHIVSGIVHDKFGYDNVGFHLGDDTVTLDFNGLLDRKQLLEIERLANETVWRNAAFHTYYPDEKTLPTLDYRSKKELSGAVRIVEIDGCDRCACCAPHVSSAAEIGLIKLLDFIKMRGGVRIVLKCGSRALDDYNVKYANVQEIGNLLSVKQEETADAVNRLNAQLGEEKQHSTALKHRLIDALIRSADSAFPAVFADGLDVRELQLMADGLVKRFGGIRAAFSPAEQDTFSFAICGEPQELEAFFSGFRKKFAVRGGGRGGMVQGTLTAAKQDLKLYFQFDL